jgi:hypothetical protein
VPTGRMRGRSCQQQFLANKTDAHLIVCSIMLQHAAAEMIAARKKSWTFTSKLVVLKLEAVEK